MGRAPLAATAEDIEQMKRVEQELAQVLVKYRSTTEAAILVFACVRVARTLLGVYSEEARSDFRTACVDFLREQSDSREDPAARLLTEKGPC